MTALAGYSGKVVRFNSSEYQIAEMSEWSLDVNADILEVTEFGDGWKVKIAGLKDWTGSFSGRFDESDTNGQDALWSALTGGTMETLRLFVNATKYWTGTALISSESPSASVDSTVDAEFGFEGSGALTPPA